MTNLILKFGFFLWLTPLHAISQIQGKVELVKYLFSPDNLSESYKISTTVWYQGHQSIQQVPHFDSKTDSTGTKTNIYVKYYLFIDTDLRQYFYYGNFSDSSKAIIHFKGKNQFAKYGGWDLYSNKEFEYDSRLKLTDTTINEIVFNRNKFHRGNNNASNDFILYTVCEKENIPIRYMKSLSEKLGCPVTRMDTYYEGRLVAIDQFQYVSDTLTNEEIRIFSAWKKKCREWCYKKKLMATTHL